VRILEQFSNEKYSITVTDFGIVNSCKEEQSLKAFVLILVIPSFKEIYCNEVQPSKALASIIPVQFKILTFSMLMQLLQIGLIRLMDQLITSKMINQKES
jgi:hypothetical protein